MSKKTCNDKLQQITISALCVLLVLLSFIAASMAVTKKKGKAKESKPIPAGRAVLWREPADIRRRDLFLGPGGEAMKPDLRHVTLIEEEKGGYSKKYLVRDASGNEWVAKLGKEAQSETAATHLLWGVGYFTDVNYLVPDVRVDGLNKPLHNVRFSARPKNEKRFDGFNWNSNPFVGTREFQALKLMMALINNWDIKDSNNKIIVVKDRNGENELQYEVHDLGGTFGKIRHIPRFLQFKPDRNNPTAYAKSHLVDKVKDGNVRLHFSTKQGRLFKDISVNDAHWLGMLLSRLSQRQIEDAFRSANYSPEQVRLMTGGVQRRIAELVDLPSSSRIAERAHKTMP